MPYDRRVDIPTYRQLILHLLDSFFSLRQVHSVERVPTVPLAADSHRVLALTLHVPRSSRIRRGWNFFLTRMFTFFCPASPTSLLPSRHHLKECEQSRSANSPAVCPCQHLNIAFVLLVRSMMQKGVFDLDVHLFATLRSCPPFFVRAELLCLSRFVFIPGRVGRLPGHKSNRDDGRQVGVFDIVNGRGRLLYRVKST